MANRFIRNACLVCPIVSDYENVKKGTLVTLLSPANGYDYDDRSRSEHYWRVRVAQLPVLHSTKKSGKSLPQSGVSVGAEIIIPDKYLGDPFKEEHIDLLKRVYSESSKNNVSIKKRDVSSAIIVQYGTPRGMTDYTGFYLKISKFLRAVLNLSEGNHICFFADNLNKGLYLGVLPKGVTSFGIPVRKDGVVLEPFVAKQTWMLHRHMSGTLGLTPSSLSSSADKLKALMHVNTLSPITDPAQPGITFYRCSPSYEFLLYQGITSVLGANSRRKITRKSNSLLHWNRLLSVVYEHIDYNPDVSDNSRMSTILRILSASEAHSAEVPPTNFRAYWEGLIQELLGADATPNSESE